MAESTPEVNVNVIIREIMSANGIRPSDIPEESPFQIKRFIASLRRKKRWSHRYFKGHAFGEFHCSNDVCGNTWTSPHSWCVLDLKEQTMIMKFKQQCIKKKKHLKISKLDLEDSKVLDLPPRKHQASGTSKSDGDSSFSSGDSESGESSSEDERSESDDPEYSRPEGEYPTYMNEDSVRRMVDWAVHLYLDLVSGRKEKEPKPEYPDDHTPTAPHPRYLCQMCKLLRRPCNRVQRKKETSSST